MEESPEPRPGEQPGPPAAGPGREPVVLTTERLVLRAPHESDIDAIEAACQDPEIQRWTVVPVPYLRGDAEYFVSDLARNGWRTGENPIWCVIERESGALVGTQGLTLPAGRPGVAEIGWWATKEFRGRGYTAEAATAVARYGLAELGLRRLEWIAYVGNEGSRAVAAKVGFRFEGTLRAYAQQRGQFHDSWIASLLPGDLAD
ncbi:Protein N-acetyltransferase, RimJ/RimL family [Streptomyces sp. TLI_053]|uniref:GNAT family N-acetyltransferase n=1 Tax=Streptomyces sp. TLI_053 TaxID=1855352 RepID=UPI0008794702|nr:GNAT family N-acetyltransferase [Streptomyces sp. TLI_053]SDT75477.1 Protein N-acetyltransferase, RimJ/RimL family [Streptomyces sp. TLI_053]